MLTLGLLLVAAMALTATLAWAGVRAAALALVLESLLWLRVDSAFEGPLLLRFSYYHGFVLADLVAVLMLSIAFVAWRRRPAAVGAES